MAIPQPRVVTSQPQSHRDVTPSIRTFVIPQELIAVVAYMRWQRRCEECKHEAHGFDLEDWYEAESEVCHHLALMTFDDIDLFIGCLSRENMTPSEDRIRTRAYFLWESAQNVWTESEHRRDFWSEAEYLEREILFAQRFLDFWNRRMQMSVFSG